MKKNPVLSLYKRLYLNKIIRREHIGSVMGPVLVENLYSRGLNDISMKSFHSYSLDTINGGDILRETGHEKNYSWMP